MLNRGWQRGGHMIRIFTSPFILPTVTPIYRFTLLAEDAYREELFVPAGTW
jgi:hypothetical protein